MRKDYIEVKSQVEDDLIFVDQFWSERWDSRRLGLEENVNRREEYAYLRSILTLQSGARILDAGCGLGEWTVCLRKQGFDAVGLDISQRTIERLQARFADCTFVCGDIRHTSFAPGEFDICFS